MKAMVLAAGIGSRLKPLTEERPKALIEVAGKPMLEIVIRRLIGAGTTEVIVNVFHLPQMIVDFLEKNRNFGIRIAVSREENLLDTGGGLKKASPFFDDGKPFFVHNVDVVSDLDLTALYQAHLNGRSLATLAVRKRDSGRRLLFYPDGRLCGRESAEGRQWAAGPVENAQAFPFDGVHVLSPEILPRLTETGAFPITRPYLRLAGEDERIQAFRSEDGYWADIGGPDKLEAVRRRAEKTGLPR